MKSVLELDKNVRALIEGLESIGALENTILIFTSDHGEEFFEHGNFGHLPKLHDENLRVPLLIWGLEIKGRVRDYVGSVDILPTVLDVTGISKSKLGKSILNIIDGKSLLNPPEDRVILSETLMNSGISKILMDLMLHKGTKIDYSAFKVALRATS